MNIPTPHIEAGYGDFAPVVIMPGDPLRAKVIAEDYLGGARQVNAVRGMLGFTGKYRGVPLSVMGSGMGMPSMGIYSWELFNLYGVESIIRVGTAGAVGEGVEVLDVVAGIACCTNSNFAVQYRLPGTAAPACSYELLRRAADAAKNTGVNLKAGTLLTSDNFYDDAHSLGEWRKMGVLAVEMEAAALYLTAARSGKHALAIVTVADYPLRGEINTTSAQERQNSFRKMMELALETAVSESLSS